MPKESKVKKVMKTPLDKLVGVLTKEEAAEMREHIRQSREMTEKRLAKLRKRLDKIFSQS